MGRAEPKTTDRYIKAAELLDAAIGEPVQRRGSSSCFRCCTPVRDFGSRTPPLPAYSTKPTFSAYGALRKKLLQLQLVHCWAHVRCKFVEREAFFPEECARVLDLIGWL